MSNPNNGKGKAPASDSPASDLKTQNHSQRTNPSYAAPADTSQESGIYSRVASSARSLARDVWGSDAGGGASSMTSLLASTASSSQKGSSITNGSTQVVSSAAGALSEARQVGNLPRSSQTSISDAKGKGRSTVSPGDQAFEAFAYPENYLHEPPILGRTAIDESAAVNGGVFESEREDGAAVVDLLNDTNNEMWHNPATIDTDFNDGAEVSADDLFSSDSDLIQEVNGKIGGPQQHRAPSPSNSRNFHPQVEMLHLPTSVTPPITDNQVDWSSEGWAKSTRYTLDISSSSKSNNAPAYFHSSHEQRAEWMGQWLNDWDSVLRNYTDDVWSPDQIESVREAKEALEELKSEEDKSGWRLDDEKAVRRLKMVLGHIRLPSNPQE